MTSKLLVAALLELRKYKTKSPRDDPAVNVSALLLSEGQGIDALRVRAGKYVCSLLVCFDSIGKRLGSNVFATV